MWRGEYTKIEGYCELLHHHIYNSKVLYKHLENQTYKNKNMTHPYAFPPVICSLLPSLTFKHLSAPSSGHDSHGRILLLILMAITASEKELVPPKAYKIQWLSESFRGDVQSRSTCE